MSLPINPPAVPASPHSGGNALLKSGKADTQAEKFSFFDFLDVINPLQHIPIVNNIYREVTGDKINNAARIAGGTLFGGMVGAALGIVNAVTVNESGQDVGGIVMSKMGFTHPDQAVAAAKSTDNLSTPQVATKDIPVVEIRPSDKLASKNDIQWDKPVLMASVPAPNIAPTIPAAMPTPEELNSLEPGAAPDNIDQPNVQKNMMEALSKYSAMQKVGDQAAAKPNFANLMSSPSTPVSENTAQPSAQFRKLRRY